MNESELDVVYTHLCKTMTQLGEANAQLFLARFALLALHTIGDADTGQRLIDEAGARMSETSPSGDR